MGCDIHVFVEHRSGTAWRLLGRFRPDQDYVMFGILAGVRDTTVQAIAAPRGMPPTCAFDTWLATMENHTGRAELGAQDLSRLRMGRMIGADLSHIVGPNTGLHNHSWLTAPELATAVDRREALHPAPDIGWRALLDLVQELPGGRIVFFFDG